MNSPAQGKQSRAAVAPAAGQMRACDPQRLARAQQHWRGAIEVDALERFASALVDAQEQVQWQAWFSVAPGADGEPTAWMRLDYSVRTRIACGLCAEPLELQIDEQSRFTFAAGEDDASRLDEQAYDHDVIVAEPSFDLLDLIEDELILALPVHAQHEVCPTALQGAGSGDGLPGEEGNSGPRQTQRPFADLATQMKAAGKSGGQTGRGSQADRDAAEPDSEPGGGA